MAYSRKEFIDMASNKTNSKKNSGRSWKSERASVNRGNSSKPKSNKYSSKSDSKSRADANNKGERYWRAGYTRKDGTKVKGHYVNRKTSLNEKIVDAVSED
jgi:hypothetical protein